MKHQRLMMRPRHKRGKEKSTTIGAVQRRIFRKGLTVTDKNFADRLTNAIREKKTPLIVGLDPVYENLPPAIINRPGFSDGSSCTACVDAISEFGRKIIRTVAPHVPAVKINIAYFERYLWDGVEAYYNLVQEAHGHGLLVIGDVKRGDIGHTSTQYALGNLGDCKWQDTVTTIGPDAITINAYFGIDGIAPFMDVAKVQGKGAFALLRTSNASAYGEVSSSGVGSSSTISCFFRAVTNVARTSPRTYSRTKGRKILEKVTISGVGASNAESTARINTA